MGVLDVDTATQIAQEWLVAFNAHRADHVVAHFAEDVTAVSPMIAQLRSHSGGRLEGKAEVRAFYEDGLRAVPDLHFTLVEVLTGIDQLTIVYRNQHGTLIAETLTLRGDGFVHAVNVTYGAAPAAP